jgi:hypothetical protein
MYHSQLLSSYSSIPKQLSRCLRAVIQFRLSLSPDSVFTELT